jgi:hypothetical protein
MIYFEAVSIEQIESYINDFFSQKLIFNNYFGIDLSDVEIVKTSKSLIIRKPFVGFHRIYVLSVDESDLISVLKDIPVDHAVNIPTKKDITLLEEILLKGGFSKFASYERYRNVKKFVKSGELIDYYANPSDFDEIKAGLHSVFSPVTGWLPDDNALGVMIENKQVMINRDDQGLSGIIIYTINNKKADLNAWVGWRGQGIYLFLNMFNLLAEKEVRIANAWINQINSSVKKMYKIMGFKPDGLKDYTYLKK